MHHTFLSIFAINYYYYFLMSQDSCSIFVKDFAHKHFSRGDTKQHEGVEIMIASKYLLTIFTILFIDVSTFSFCGHFEAIILHPFHEN